MEKLICTQVSLYAPNHLVIIIYVWVRCRIWSWSWSCICKIRYIILLSLDTDKRMFTKFSSSAQLVVIIWTKKTLQVHSIGWSLKDWNSKLRLVTRVDHLQVESLPLPLKSGDELSHKHWSDPSSSITAAQYKNCCDQSQQWSLPSLEWIHRSDFLCKVYQSRHWYWRNAFLNLFFTHYLPIPVSELRSVRAWQSLHKVINAAKFKWKMTHMASQTITWCL